MFSLQGRFFPARAGSSGGRLPSIIRELRGWRGWRRLLLWSATAGFWPSAPAWAGLMDFVAQPDKSYRYEPGATWQDGDLTYQELLLTSQTFKGTAWRHVLTIAKPARLGSHNHALLLIGGGRHDDPPPNGSGGAKTPKALLKSIGDLARHGTMPVVLLRQVPYQPIFETLIEDEALAYTFNQFLRGKDDTWPLLQPMVKSVVRAMDATQDFCRQRWQLDINSFTVSGESKRAWTAYLASAIDPRIKGLAPIVFDILNIEPQLRHQMASWGQYSEQLGDYSEQGLPKMLTTPRGAELLAIVDPYAYRQRLTQPKVLILSTNDRYWPVDAASLYFEALPGPKFLRYLPNSGHEPADAAAVEQAQLAVAMAAAGMVQLPTASGAFTQRHTGGGVLSLGSEQQPMRVRLWQATAKTRDFRGAAWKAVKTLAPAHKVEADLAVPAKGYLAAFLEAEFALNDQAHFVLCSPLAVVGPKSAGHRH